MYRLAIKKGMVYQSQLAFVGKQITWEKLYKHMRFLLILFMNVLQNVILPYYLCYDDLSVPGWGRRWSLLIVNEPKVLSK